MGPGLSVRQRLLLLLLTLLLTGCNGLPSLPDLPWQSTPAPVVHLNTWLPAGDEASAELIRAQLDDFVTATDGISMTVTLLEERPRTLAQFLADDPAPDLLEVDLFTLPQLVDEGLVAALPFDTALMDEFHPLLREAVTFNGTVYCLPKDAHTLGLYYNRALFDAAGTGYPNVSWSWADLVAASEAIGDLPTVEFSAFGVAVGADVSRWLPLYLQAGGEWPPVDGLDPVALRTALTRYEQLFAEGLAITPSYYGRSWSGPVFGNSRVGLVIEGNWLAGYLAEDFPGMDYGVAPLPAGPSGSATVAFGACYGVTATSSEQAHAFALARYLAGHEAMTQRLEMSVAIPARTATAVIWEATYPDLRALRTQMDGAILWQVGTADKQTLDMLQRVLVDLIAGDLTIDEAIDEIVSTEQLGTIK